MADARATFAIALVVAAMSPRPAPAALDYSSIGSTYNQNFDSLANSEDLNPHAWANDSTILGWHLFRVTAGNPYNPAPVPVTSYDASSGTAEGQFYSFGTGGSSERALGAVGFANFAGATSAGFGKVLGWVAASFTNNTGGSLTQFTVGYDGEQWRDGGNDPPEAQAMVFEYGFGSSFDAVSTWTAPSGNFDWNSPVGTTSPGAVNGNAAGLVTNRGGTITNLAWTAGDSLWLRWVELNNGGADHGLAVDDFSFTANTNAIPEPGAVLFGGLVYVVIGVGVGARRLVGRLRTRDAT
jgi:hypothetical protein